MLTNLNRRQLEIMTSLDEGQLLLIDFAGTECLSQPYGYQLSLLSTVSLDTNGLIGQSATVTVRSGGNESHFHGYLHTLEAQGRIEDTHSVYYRYHATLTPWYKALEQVTDSRVFQGLSVLDIFHQICVTYPRQRYELKLDKDYPKLTVCTQYQESHRTFLDRILADAGIYYYFTHDDKEHTLVLTDALNKLSHYPHTVPYEKDTTRFKPPYLSGRKKTEQVYSQGEYLQVFTQHSPKSPLAQGSDVPKKKQTALAKTLVRHKTVGQSFSPNTLRTLATQETQAREWQAHVIHAQGLVYGLHTGMYLDVSTQNSVCP